MTKARIKFSPAGDKSFAFGQNGTRPVAQNKRELFRLQTRVIKTSTANSYQLFASSRENLNTNGAITCPSQGQPD